MSFVSGLIIDRFGYIRAWSLSAALWSGCTLAFSVAQGFWSLLILRILLGIAEAIHFPALLKTTSDWIVPALRARAISYGLLGVPISMLLGAPLLTALISFLGWRGMFVTLGLLGLLWAVIWPLCFRHHKNPHYTAAGLAKIPETSISMKDFFLFQKNPAFIANCIGYFSFGSILFFALFWFPGYVQQQLHQNLLSTGALLMVPWALSAFSLIFGGALSDLIWKRTHSSRKARTLLIAPALLLSGICFYLLTFSTSLLLDIICLSLGLGCAFFANAPIYASNVDLFPHRAATAQGIMCGYAALAGIIAPTLTGLFIQTTGTFQSAFVLVATISATGALVLFFIQKK